MRSVVSKRADEWWFDAEPDVCDRTFLIQRENPAVHGAEDVTYKLEDNADFSIITRTA